MYSEVYDLGMLVIPVLSSALGQKDAREMSTSKTM